MNKIILQSESSNQIKELFLILISDFIWFTMNEILELPTIIKDSDIKIEELSEYERYAKDLKSYLPDLPKVDLIIKNYSYEVKKSCNEFSNIPNIINGAYHDLVDCFGLSSKKIQVVLKDVNYHFKSGSSTLVFNIFYIT